MHQHYAGAVLFTINVQALAKFYERVAGLRVHRVEEDHVTLEMESFRLTVHRIPEQYARDIVITAPPAVREMSAIKLAFRVDSIASSRQAAAALGGLVHGPQREWSYESAAICDGYDPDGNVFQLFEPADR